MEKFDLVILGGGVSGACAAYAAASKSRDSKKRLSVALISDEEAIYSRGALPSLIAREISSLKEISVYPVSQLRRLGVNFYKRHEILSVDFGEKSVSIKNLENERKTEVAFKKLIIATGSLPKVPPVKGANLKGVYTVKWFKDAKELSKKAKPKMKALVVGAGLIGMETAYALRKLNLDVTLIEMLPNILSGVLEPRLSSYVKAKAESMGVKVRVNCTLDGIEGKRKVEAAVLNGEKAAFDFVVFCVGVKPNTKIFAESDLNVAEYGAIKIDSQMRTSVEDVYAIGDCAEKIDFITKRPVHRPLGSLATRTAEIAGINALGANVEFEGSIRHQYDYVFGTHISSMGLSSTEASSLGLSTETIDVKLSRNSAFYQEPLKIPLGTKMCTIINKKDDRIVGWQSVGPSRLVSFYNVFIDEIIRKGGSVKDIQEAGLEVS
ncbi:MAG: FAD-dependent oxidoreductase [Candidatus Bathyarchaeia archaeon]